MSEPAPAEPEPSPAEKFAAMDALVRRVMAVPKAEVDKREEEWRRQREAKKRDRKKAA